MITAAIGVLIMPWKLLATTGGYIFVWLAGYSALLGPIAGILIADYWLIRRTRLDVDALYRADGRYAYRGGWNPAALVAFAAGVLPNLPGFLKTAAPGAFAWIGAGLGGGLRLCLVHRPGVGAGGLCGADVARSCAAAMKLAAIPLFGLPAMAAAAAAQPQPQPPAPAAQQALRDRVDAAVREGHAKLRRRRPAEALADFDRVIALAPDWPPGQAYRGLALIDLRRYDEAEAAMATALRLGPADPFVHRGIGYLRLNLGEFAASVRSYSRSLELAPGDAEALDRRAQAYQGLGQMDQALADLDRIIAAAPGDANAHFQRARIFAHWGQQAEALAAIDRAIAGAPRDYYYPSWRGDFLERFDRRDEAAAAYREAVAKLDAVVERARPGPPPDWAMETRLNLLGRAGRHAEALAIVAAELVRSPGSPAMLAARCWLRMEAGIELALALGDCDRALAREPNHPVAAAARARLYLKLRRWAEAERAFDALLVNGGRSESNALYGRGLARLRQGDGARGERDLREARRRKFDVAWEFDRIGLDPAGPIRPLRSP